MAVTKNQMTEWLRSLGKGTPKSDSESTNTSTPGKTPLALPPPEARSPNFEFYEVEEPAEKDKEMVL